MYIMCSINTWGYDILIFETSFQKKIHRLASTASDKKGAKIQHDISAASLASTTSTALFHQRIFWTWWLDHPWHQNYQYWSLFEEWIESSKIQFFTDIWYPFCWRLLRPAYVTFLKAGFKYQNVITSGIYRTHYIHEIINPDTSQSQFTLSISMWDTL